MAEYTPIPESDPYDIDVPDDNRFDDAKPTKQALLTRFYLLRRRLNFRPRKKKKAVFMNPRFFLKI